MGYVAGGEEATGWRGLRGRGSREVVERKTGGTDTAPVGEEGEEGEDGEERDAVSKKRSSQRAMPGTAR